MYYNKWVPSTKLIIQIQTRNNINRSIYLMTHTLAMFPKNMINWIIFITHSYMLHIVLLLLLTGWVSFFICNEFLFCLIKFFFHLSKQDVISGWPFNTITLFLGMDWPNCSLVYFYLMVRRNIRCFVYFA